VVKSVIRELNEQPDYNTFFKQVKTPNGYTEA